MFNSTRPASFLGAVASLSLLCLFFMHSGSSSDTPSLALKERHALHSATSNEATPSYDLQKLEAMHLIMLAEMAWHREKIDESINYYLMALKIYPDHQAASRATELSLMADSFDHALFAAQQWASLATKNQHAQAIMLTLLAKADDAAAMGPFLHNLYQMDEEKLSQAIVLISSQLSTSWEKEALYQAVKQFYQQHPQSSKSDYVMAFMADLMGEHFLALATIKKVATENPGWHKAVLLYVQFLKENNQVPEALQFLQHSREKHPENKLLRMTYAKLLSEFFYYEQAVTEFSALMQADDYRAESQLHLAVIAFEQHRFADAKRYLQLLVQENPYDDVGNYYLGLILEREKAYNKAMQHYERVGLGQYYLHAQTSIAILTARTGHLAAALSMIHSLILQYPQHKKPLTINSVHILLEAEEHSSAMQILDQAVQKTPQDIELLYARSIVATHIDEIGQAETDLLQVIAIDPTHVDALNALGFILADKTDRYAEALDYIEQAIALEPNNPSVIDSMGWVLYRLQRYEEALHYLQRAFALTREAEIAAHLGEVLWVSGKTEAAKAIWQEALAEEPGHEVLLEIIQRFTLIEQH